MNYKVNGISHRGEGVIRIDGKACFVPFAILDETIAVAVGETKKNYMRGTLDQVVERSPYRVDPLCPHFYECGGCDWQHVAYSQQLLFKQQIISQQMKRIAKIPMEVNPVLGMPDPWHYRNKVSWQVGRREGGLCLAFFRRDSHEPIPFQQCRIISAEMAEVGEWLNRNIEDIGLQPGDRVELRQSNVDRRLLLLIYGRPDEAFLFAYLLKVFPALGGIHVITEEAEYTILGEPYLIQELAGLQYRIFARSFFQVNSQQAEALYQEIAQRIPDQPPLKILDAYCGAGTISCMLAKKGHQVLGVEGNPSAIEDARYNRKLNHIAKKQCRFICGLCETEVPNLLEGLDLLLLDPPRAGCHPALIQAIIAQPVPQIIYVSCDPATLARDISLLSAVGYRPDPLQPVDMFAQTGHVETVVLMSRV